MGRQIVLRKCSEHEHCQIQSTNGGEWEHTPDTRPLRQRLQPAPSPDNLEARLASEIAAAGELAGRLRAKDQRAEDLLYGLDTRAARLGQLEGIRQQVADGHARLLTSVESTSQAAAALATRVEQAEALLTRLSDYSRELGGVEQRLTDAQVRNEEIADRLSTLTLRNEQALSELQERAKRLAQIESTYRELDSPSRLRDVAVRLEEQSRQADAWLSHLFERARKVERIESVYRELEDAIADQRAASATSHERINAVADELRREREERVANTRKIMRSIQTLADGGNRG